MLEIAVARVVFGILFALASIALAPPAVAQDFYKGKTVTLIVGNFGRPGPYPGEFNQAHGLAIDSQGSIYVNENRGRRTQKFKLVGG